jgi:NADPH-dependent curcumin reductase CurA
MTSNTQIVLRERPTSTINPDLENGTFALKEGQKVEDDKIPADHILVKVLYTSIDPAMRGWLNDTRSYVPPVQIGEVMRSFGVGEVVASKSENFSKGDQVRGIFGWQEYAVVSGDIGGPMSTTKLEDVQGVDIQDHLGVLGLSGLTAYFGVFNILDLKGGEVVIVNGAAGSVGYVVVQLCKIKGCKGEQGKGER